MGRESQAIIAQPAISIWRREESWLSKDGISKNGWRKRKRHLKGVKPGGGGRKAANIYLRFKRSSTGALFALGKRARKRWATLSSRAARQAIHRAYQRQQPRQCFNNIACGGGVLNKLTRLLSALCF